jgi:fructose-1-phosphate kinase PfkB-like protein
MPTHSFTPSTTVIIGLNAALQKRFILPPTTKLEPGNVHRSQRVEIGIGGKGQDVAVSMTCLNDDCRNVLLTQFIGRGGEGDLVLEALKQRNLSDEMTIRNAAPLRTCTTIVSEECATELVENSGIITNEERQELLDRVESMANDGKASSLCIMGSMPPGCDDTTYAELAKRLVDDDSLVLIDSVVGLQPLLTALGGIYNENSNGGVVLKLNAAELCKLANVSKKESDCVTSEELQLAITNFMELENADALDYLCVTDGKFPGYLIELASATSFRTWKMDRVDLSSKGTLYPIGGGDTVAAGTLAAWQYLHSNSGVISSTTGAKLLEKQTLWSKGLNGERSVQLATAFAFGIACGSASCLKEENSVFDVTDAEAFLRGMSEPVLME